MTTEEKVLRIIKSFKGELHSRQIAKKLGISPGYADLILQSLERRKIIKLSSGWISLFEAEAKERAKPQTIKRQISRNKRARTLFSSASKTSADKKVEPHGLTPVTPSVSSAGQNPSKQNTKTRIHPRLYSHGVLRRRVKPGKPEKKIKEVKNPKKQGAKSPLLKFKGMTRGLEKILEKAGYKKVEDLARASLVRLMQDTGLKLKQAANLINKTRRRLKIIKWH